MSDTKLTQAQPAVPPTTKPIGFFQDADGNLSSIRLAFLLWAAGVLVVWIIMSLKGTKLADIPPEVLTVLGILMTGKVVQKFSE